MGVVGVERSGQAVFLLFLVGGGEIGRGETLSIATLRFRSPRSEKGEELLVLVSCIMRMRRNAARATDVAKCGEMRRIFGAFWAY